MAQKLKKKFFEVEIPLTNSHAELLAYDVDSLKNRSIKLDLTRQLRGKSIEVLFKVDVKGKEAVAHPVKMTLLPFFIRRMLRKKISYVEDSFLAECRDAHVRIKPFLIARKRVSRAVRNALRNETKDWLQIYVKEKNYKDIFSDIISNRLQKPLSLKLKKIYPLALCEVRKFELVRLKEEGEIKIETEKIQEKPEKNEDKKEEVKKQEKPKEEPEEKKKTKKKPEEKNEDKKEEKK